MPVDTPEKARRFGFRAVSVSGPREIDGVGQSRCCAGRHCFVPFGVDHMTVTFRTTCHLSPSLPRKNMSTTAVLRPKDDLTCFDVLGLVTSSRRHGVTPIRTTILVYSIRDNARQTCVLSHVCITCNKLPCQCCTYDRKYPYPRNDT